MVFLKLMLKTFYKFIPKCNLCSHIFETTWSNVIQMVKLPICTLPSVQLPEIVVCNACWSNVQNNSDGLHRAAAYCFLTQHLWVAVLHSFQWSPSSTLHNLGQAIQKVILHKQYWRWLYCSFSILNYFFFINEYSKWIIAIINEYWSAMYKIIIKSYNYYIKLSNGSINLLWVASASVELRADWCWINASTDSSQRL